ncbi:hypothetical protein [Polyangium sp. 6x1]|uniref:hypothetical protein n=1 Tax=Polyangium sp. 6x1 TaxID=3042689 RepID=UPI0024825409|nr:hypothetical protein [Polyangium sp. 6x1]MDI1445760.1 hypothetical protein [Polyangium sp. 6x1]
MSIRSALESLLAILLFPACAAETPESVGEDVTALAPSCASSSDCTEGLGCVEGACSACKHHAQCASDVCDIYQGGRCIPEAEVLYVGRRAVSHYEECDKATGARGDPFCQIRDAVSAIGAGKTVIRAAPGFYLPFHVDGLQAFSVFGPAGEGGIAQLTEEDVGGASVRGGAVVVLDGLEIGRYSYGAGLRCAGPGTRLVVRRSQIYTNPRSDMQSDGCDLVLEDTEVIPRDYDPF